MSSTGAKRILRKQLELVNAAIQDSEARAGGRTGPTHRRLGLAGAAKKRRLTTREQLVRAREQEAAREDLTLANLRALVPADAYALAAAKVRASTSSGSTEEDEAEEREYVAQARKAAAAAAATRLETTYEDATLGAYMQSLKRLHGETPEQRKRRRAHTEVFELASSVAAIGSSVPHEVFVRAAASNPHSDDGDAELNRKKRKKKDARLAAKKRAGAKKKKKGAKSTEDADLEEAKLAMSVRTIARAAAKLSKKNKQ